MASGGPTLVEELNEDIAPIIKLVRLVCLATWGRNHLAGTWGPKHGSLLMIPNRRALRKMLKSDLGFCFAETDWTDEQPIEADQEMAEAVAHARGSMEDSLVVAIVVESGECMAVIVPSSRDRMFPDDATFRQAMQLTHRLHKPRVNVNNAKDLMSSALLQCGGCQTPLHGRKRHLCARCKSTYYCDRSCQVQAWPSHKCICHAR